MRSLTIEGTSGQSILFLNFGEFSSFSCNTVLYEKGWGGLLSKTTKRMQLSKFESAPWGGTCISKYSVQNCKSLNF